jgi:hypothetical protein
MRRGLIPSSFAYLIAAISPVILSAACPVTSPPSPPFVAPAPYPPNAPEGRFWYGSNGLWTLLGNRSWSMANNVLRGHGYRNKLIFWRQDFDWRGEGARKIIVTARRIDGGAAPPVFAEPANAVFSSGDTPAIMTAIDIPGEGCWEIIANLNGDKLRYVVAVIK